MVSSHAGVLQLARKKIGEPRQPYLTAKLVCIITTILGYIVQLNGSGEADANGNDDRIDWPGFLKVALQLELFKTG